MLSKKLFGLFAGIMMFAASFGASAQNMTVRGTVSDNVGPIVGAVVLSGGANAVTDMNGAFTISVPSNAVLEVSCLGYVSQQVPVNGRSNINVVLAEDVEVLQEAIALGYGAQTKKKDLSASVGIVENPEKLAGRPVTSTTGMLQGQIPGVVVSYSNGSPDSGPSILIRGQGSQNGDSVLWVVDGVPGGPITSMNDIESIVVLKDAASAAIYGATSGAGGVIIVTTKKAQKGIHVEYDLVTGIRHASNLPEPLTAEEEIRMRTIASQNAGITLDTGWDPAVNPWIATTRTNWMDEVFRDALYQRHSATLNYGTDQLKSRLTFTYSDNPGVLVGTYAKSYGIRYNGEYQMNKWIKITENIHFSDGSSRGTDTGSSHTGTILSALYMPPSAEAYATAGPYAGSYGGTTTEDPEYIAKYGSNFAGLHGDAVNPLRLLLADTNYNHRISFWSTTGLEIANIVKGLKFVDQFSYNIGSGYSKNFTPKRPEIGKPSLTNSLSESADRSDGWRNEATLTYDRTFGKHTVGALGAFTANRDWNRGFSMSASSFDIEDPSMVYFSQTSSYGVPSDYYNNDANVAMVGRLSYSFDDRYFVTASYRRDIAGRLPNEHNYGDFPAVTGAWKISSEPFFPKTDAINLLKVRASWGRVGNLGSIGWHYKSPTLSDMGDHTDNRMAGRELGGQLRGTTYSLRDAFNSRLTWETSEQTDLGLDIDLFKDRLSMSLDLYNKKTFNLIQTQSTDWPTAIGIEPMLVNLGEINNRGVEFVASWRDKVGQDFNYYVTGNFAYNRNRVVDTGVFDSEGKAAPWLRNDSYGLVTTSIYRSENGQPLNFFYMIPCEGIFQSEEDIYDHMKDGKLIQPGARPGDLKFTDVNGDGKISTDDRVYCGNPTPLYTFALSAGFNWKGFNVDMMLQGVAGNKIAYMAKQLIFADVEGNFSRAKDILNAWSPENRDSTIPILSRNDPNGNLQTPSSWYLEDGSYLRLKNLTVGYDFTKLLRKAPHFAERGSSLNVYFSAENLLTLTKYSGMDPEVGGYDTLTYPVHKIFAFGLKLNY